MAVRLCNENLSQVPGFFSVPTYDRSELKATIFHIGLSRFARAHIISFADELNQRQHDAGQRPTHGVIAVNMHSHEVRDALAPQDNLYTVTRKGKGITECRVVGALADVLIAKENPQAVIEAGANPDITTISITVTQAGYNFDKDRGVDFGNKDIKADLERNGAAHSTIGMIYAILDLRRQRGIAPPTVLSCDNLETNGTRLRNAVLAFAEVKSRATAAWILNNVAFPNTMVDCITPSARKEHEQFIASKGVLDLAHIEAEPVPGTPFVIQNIVSKDPVTQKPITLPDFASVGAVVAEKVANFELLKLRSLNGAHMALGCIGHVLKYEHANEAMQDPVVRSFIQGFMQEAGQTLHPTEGVDQQQYRRGLLTRLDNDQIRDPLTRLARNGCEDKVKARIANTLQDCLREANLHHEHSAFALASWVEYLKTLDKEGYLKGVRYYDKNQNPMDVASPEHVVGSERYDIKGVKIEPNDKKAAAIGLIDHVHKNAREIGPILAYKQLELEDMATNTNVHAAVDRHLLAIEQKGFARAFMDFVEEHPFAFIEEANDNIEPDVKVARASALVLQPS